MQIFTECNLASIVVELLNGKTVVFPTETSYGLGCDATNQEAVDKIFKIKGRPSDKPLLIVVPSVEMAKKYLVWNDALEKIAKKYWPGAVTVVGEAFTPPPPQWRGQGEDIAQNRHFSFEKIIGSIKTLGHRREMRKNPTKAEKILWSSLRNKRLGGIKFYRQHGIGPFIVDFYHPETRTIIEVDGDIHFVDGSNIKKDQDRQKWLENNEYRVFRYNNVDIFGNLEWILKEIYHHVTTSPPPAPSAAAEGERQHAPMLAKGVLSNSNTLALRVTSHPLLKSITEKMGRPLVATSANVSDAGDIYGANEIIKQFESRSIQPDIVLNYGKLPKNKPSTIVSVVRGEAKVLRQGDVEISNISARGGSASGGE